MLLRIPLHCVIRGVEFCISILTLLIVVLSGALDLSLALNSPHAVSNELAVVEQHLGLVKSPVYCIFHPDLVRALVLLRMLTLVKGALFADTKLYRSVASNFISRLSPFMLRFHFKLKVVFGKGLGVVTSNWLNWMLLISFRFSRDMSGFLGVINLGSYGLSIVGLGSVRGVLILVLENRRNALVSLCISYLVHTIS